MRHRQKMPSPLFSNQNHHMLKKRNIIPAITQEMVNPVCRLAKYVVILVFVLIYGSAAAEHGRLSRSQEVTRAFETYQVFADHRYYYLNQENDPYAVVALQSSYTINDPTWRELDPNSETFKKVIGLVEGFRVYSIFPTYGSYISDHQMNRIGYWYSSLRAVSISVDNVRRKVSINTEKPWLQDDDERFIPGFGRGIRFRF